MNSGSKQKDFFLKKKTAAKQENRPTSSFKGEMSESTMSFILKHFGEVPEMQGKFLFLGHNDTSKFKTGRPVLEYTN